MNYIKINTKYLNYSNTIVKYYSENLKKKEIVKKCPKLKKIIGFFDDDMRIKSIFMNMFKDKLGEFIKFEDDKIAYKYNSTCDIIIDYEKNQIYKYVGSFIRRKYFVNKMLRTDFKTILINGKQIKFNDCINYVNFIKKCLMHENMYYIIKDGKIDITKDDEQINIQDNYVYFNNGNFYYKFKNSIKKLNKLEYYYKNIPRFFILDLIMYILNGDEMINSQIFEKIKLGQCSI